MTNQGFARLHDRALVAIDGADAVVFLQNLLTCDVEQLRPGIASHGALLTPQGKMLFEFILIGQESGFLVDIAAGAAAEFAKRVGFYRLRADVTITPDAKGWPVHAIWGSDERPAGNCVICDPRHPALGWRVYGNASPGGTSPDYDAHRIDIGMPESGKDYALGELFAHEALLDQTGGVNFAKGCYVGQEVVSRMQHRGTARSRIIKVSSSGEMPQTGTPITAGEKACGTMGSSSGNKGLALLRLDRVRDAMDAGLPVMAGASSITPSIPSFATFGWPSAT